MFLDDAIVEAVQTESNLLVEWGIVVVAKQVSDVVSDDHQGSASLVEVLCTLAAHWVLCECGLEIGKSGHDGWAKEGLRLGDEIDSLHSKIQRSKSASRKAAKQNELEKLRAQSDTIDKDWGEANEETNTYLEMFREACEFCKTKCTFGVHEVFNAALVDFDPTRLQPDQGPSEDRMLEMVSRLDNLHSAKWNTQQWANLSKPTMRAARRVTAEKRNSFIVRNLKHIGTVSGSFGQDNPLKGLNAGVKPRSASLRIDDKPYLGLVFQHDSTVKRIGYEGNLPIQLAPQRLKLLKFVHEAGNDGRTQSEIVPKIILNKNTLTSEKNRIKLDLKTFDIDLGPRGQYVVRCTRIAKKKSV
jgi:hypothetical protein